MRSVYSVLISAMFCMLLIVPVANARLNPKQIKDAAQIALLLKDIAGDMDELKELYPAAKFNIIALFDEARLKSVSDELILMIDDAGANGLLINGPVFSGIDANGNQTDFSGGLLFGGMGENPTDASYKSLITESNQTGVFGLTTTSFEPDEPIQNVKLSKYSKAFWVSRNSDGHFFVTTIDDPREMWARAKIARDLDRSVAATARFKPLLERLIARDRVYNATFDRFREEARRKNVYIRLTTLEASRAEAAQKVEEAYRELESARRKAKDFEALNLVAGLFQLGGIAVDAANSQAVSEAQAQYQETAVQRTSIDLNRLEGVIHNFFEESFRLRQGTLPDPVPINPPR